MKTVLCIIAAALLCGCFTSLAQTNNITDAHGYVTNSDYLLPVTLTNSAGTVTDAIPYKITLTDFMYKTPAGKMGMVPFDSLSADLRKHFGYDAAAAKAAEAAKAAAKIAGWQETVRDREQNALAAQYQQARAAAMKRQYHIDGKIIQKIDAGLLVSDSNLDPETPEYTTVLLKDYAGYDNTAAGDYVSVWTFEEGLYSYDTVNKSENTIHVFTCNLEAAIDYHLEH